MDYRLLALSALSIYVVSCSCSEPRPTAVPGDVAQAISLRDLPFHRSPEIPDSSRPEGEAAPIEIPITGPWRYIGATRQGRHKYSTRVPIRPRGLFFFRPKPGMKVINATGATVAYGPDAADGPTWTYDRRELVIHKAEKSPPSDDRFRMVYDKATEREARLNFKDAKALLPEDADFTKEDFVWTQIQDDWDARSGLLLPAPGTVEWQLTVPPSAEFHLVPGLVEPEVLQGDASDGAKLLVEVDVDGESTTVAEFTLAVRDFESKRVDLSAYAKKTVRLRLRSDPLANPNYDYVFVGSPAITSRQINPVRVVMVFIDTLRPDHMSLYGYERDTTASLDHLLQEAAVFNNARSVAPWTLPSARSIVTGRQPEYYFTAPTLPALLRKAGWANAFIAGNVYLSANFDMHRDWDFHRVGLWPPANEVTNDAIAWLDEQEGRNAIIQVHYMDPHLPYQEPLSYRRKYAGSKPDGIREEFHLQDVRRSAAAKTPEGKSYIKDRYDNNIRYATDQIARLLDHLDDNDIMVLYADHGEEFWDHGEFEHGHTLYEELLRVPMLIKAPGITPGMKDVPVSLLDLAPTILALAGHPATTEMDGVSLVPLLQGAPGADKPLRERDLAFGRPLYGLDRWGVLHGSEKWTVNEGREALYNLDEDPAESNNLLREDADDSGAPYRQHLADVLYTDVPVAYRLVPMRARPPSPATWMLCTIPGGFKHGFLGADPLTLGAAKVEFIEENPRQRAEELLAKFQITTHKLPDDDGAVVQMCWEGSQNGAREVYLVPNRDMAEVGRGLRCSAYQGDETGGQRLTFNIAANRNVSLGKYRNPLRKALLDRRGFMLSHGIVPVPLANWTILEATNNEVTDMLTSTGYLVEDRQDKAKLTGCKAPRIQLPAAPDNAYIDPR